jgi:hypothetical protein
MRHLRLLLLLAVLLMVGTGAAPSAELTVEGGDVGLAVTSATAGQDPDPDVDQTTSDLKYRKETADPTQKITVETNLGSSLFTLKVEALSAGDGTPAGERTLGTTAQDFITSITSETFVYCDLRYTSVALASDGTGTDNHTVTYTMIAQ